MATTAGARDGGVGEGEARVAQAVAEGEARLGVGLVEVPVVDVEALGVHVLDLAELGRRLDGHAGRVVVLGDGDAVRQVPAGRDLAVEDLGERVACFLAGEMRHEHGLDGRQVDPGLHDERADRVYDDHDVAVGRGRLLDELVAVVPRR